MTAGSGFGRWRLHRCWPNSKIAFSATIARLRAAIRLCPCAGGALTSQDYEGTPRARSTWPVRRPGAGRGATFGGRHHHMTAGGCVRQLGHRHRNHQQPVRRQSFSSPGPAYPDNYMNLFAPRPGIAVRSLAAGQYVSRDPSMSRLLRSRDAQARLCAWGCPRGQSSSHRDAALINLNRPRHDLQEAVEAPSRPGPMATRWKSAGRAVSVRARIAKDGPSLSHRRMATGTAGGK